MEIVDILIASVLLASIIYFSVLLIWQICKFMVWWCVIHIGPYVCEMVGVSLDDDDFEYIDSLTQEDLKKV